MSCSETNICYYRSDNPRKFECSEKFNSERYRREYSEKFLGHQYVSQYTGEIIDNGKSVVFYTTPVFDNLWYTPCNLGNDPGAFCEKYNIHTFVRGRRYDDSSNDKSYPTGIVDRENAENNNFKCYGDGCAFNGRALCGMLPVPLLGRDPPERHFPHFAEIIKTIKFDKKLKYIQVKYPSNVIDNKKTFIYVLTHMWDGNNTGKFIPRNVGLHLIRNYCERKEKDGKYYMFSREECSELKYIDKELYNNILDRLCYGTDLKNSQCRIFCGEKNINCDDRYTSYCASLTSKEALNKENSEMCGCFMGNQFYKGYFDEINKRYQFPVTTPPNHVCYFDFCASSNIKPYNEKQNPTRCPDILTCFQNVNVEFNAGGNVRTGDIIIRQDAKCGQINTKCSIQADCSKIPNSKCTEGICKGGTQPSPPEVPQPIECKNGSECLNGKCINGKCIYEPENKINYKLIIPIILLCIMIGYILL